ncbi:unnamed protein product [Colias eurytheme]|nr:unnamed protein product [Colias eurytheme]
MNMFTRLPNSSRYEWAERGIRHIQVVVTSKELQSDMNGCQPMMDRAESGPGRYVTITDDRSPPAAPDTRQI